MAVTRRDTRLTEIKRDFYQNLRLHSIGSLSLSGTFSSTVMKYRKEIKEYPDNSKGIEFQPNIPPSYWSPKKVEMFVLTLKTFDDQNVPKWRSRFLSSHYFNFDITRAFLWRSGGLKSVLYDCLNLSGRVAIYKRTWMCNDEAWDAKGNVMMWAYPLKKSWIKDGVIWHVVWNPTLENCLINSNQMKPLLVVNVGAAFL